MAISTPLVNTRTINSTVVTVMVPSGEKVRRSCLTDACGAEWRIMCLMVSFWALFGDSVDGVDLAGDLSGDRQSVVALECVPKPKLEVVDP
jgi:hypothetical protein